MLVDGAMLSFLNIYSSIILMIFGTDVQHNVPNFTVNFCNVKLKVEGRNLRIENVPLVIARLCFKMFSPNLAVLQK